MVFRLPGALLIAASLLCAQTAAPFEVEEATIAQVHDAMRAGRLTCRALVDAYLRRIDAYDKNGPAINAIVMLNPDATKEADELDRRFAQSGPDRAAALRAHDRQRQFRDQGPADHRRRAGVRRLSAGAGRVLRWRA